MLTRTLFGLVVAVVMAAGIANAENLALSGTDRWVAVASRQDLNEAISIAKTYAAQNSRVVRSQNGWFAVVLGPYATSDIGAFRRDYRGPALPRDAMLTLGGGYIETVWPAGAASPIAKSKDTDRAACIQGEHPEESIRACTNIIDSGTETSETLLVAFFDRGLAYYRTGTVSNLKLAIIDFGRAIQLKLDFGEAYYARGSVNYDLRDFVPALEDFRAAVRLLAQSDPIYNEARRRIASIEMTLGPTQEQSAARVALTNLADANRALATGLGHFANGNKERAIADFSKAIQIKPDLAEGYFNRGLVYDSQGDPDGAIDDYKKAIQLEPEFALAYNNLGLIYARRRDWDLAIASFNKAIQLKPDFGSAHYNAGMAYRSAGDTYRALSFFRAAVRINPGHSEALAQIADIEALPRPPSPASTPNVVEPPKTPTIAEGATIKVETSTQDGRDTTIISIEGGLMPGDEKHFADAVIGLGNAVVVLSSPGGDLVAGIQIGRAIRLKGFSTVVPEGFQCASACAWAWLAGSPRFMGKGATIGFHAAYVTENGENKVSSVGNAQVGAYLNQLGLPPVAVTYITEAQPNEVRWLTFDDAERNGIDVRMFPSG